MRTALARALPTLSWLLLAGIFFFEPLLANKFETIGGGVQGSTKIKVEYLQIVAYVAAGIFATAGVLAIVLRNKNAQTLSYTMWRSSAVLFFLLAVGSLTLAFFIK
jgi:uncharacterized membrane protein